MIGAGCLRLRLVWPTLYIALLRGVCGFPCLEGDVSSTWHRFDLTSKSTVVKQH